MRGKLYKTRILFSLLTGTMFFLLSACGKSENAPDLSASGQPESGLQSSAEETDMGAQLPDSGKGDTVLSASADAHNSQILYLWEEGNVPAVTEYTANNGRYSDDPDFRPYLVSFPVPEGTEVKGAVLICAGGAFQFRSDEMEGTPVAQELASRGYPGR